MSSQHDPSSNYLLYVALPANCDDSFLRALDSHNISVKVFRKQLELLQQSDLHCPDLLLMHIGFVHADEYKRLIIDFRHACIFKELPVVAVGPAEDNAGLMAAMQAGASDYVSLPMEPDQLAVRLERQLAAVRARRTLEDLELTGSPSPVSQALATAPTPWDSEVERARRYGTPLTVILFEWELTENPLATAQSKVLAEILQRKARKSDKINELSETVICVLLPGSTLHGGRAAAAHMQRTLKSEMDALHQNAGAVTWKGVRIFEMPRDYRGTGDDLLKLVQAQPADDPELRDEKTPSKPR